MIGDPGYGSNHFRSALSEREASIFDPTVYDCAKASLTWETTKCCLLRIINSLEALIDVLEGSRTCSQNELLDMVHRLAGSAATFGFSAFAKSCLDFERARRSHAKKAATYFTDLRKVTAKTLQKARFLHEAISKSNT